MDPAAILPDDCMTNDLSAATDQLLARVRDPDELIQVRLECMNSLAKIFKNVHKGAISASLPVLSILKSLRIALIDPSKDARCHVFRVLRHIALDADMVQAMVDLHMDVLILRTLTRDQRYDAEREQALKLIRTWIDVPAGAAIIPQSLVRMLVALAEQSDEKFRGISAETLCELAVRNPELVALSGGLKVILQVLLEGPSELSDALLTVLVHILDAQVTRKYLRPAVELETIISHFTDVYSKGPSHQEKLHACSKVVASLLKSWTGLLYMCMDDKRAIRTLVKALSLPTDETRRILLEMYFDIFHVGHPRKPPAETGSKRTPASQDMLSRLGPSPRFFGRANIVHQFVAVLLLVFIDAGLLEALVELVQEQGNKLIINSATHLIDKLIELGNRLLPVQFGTKLQSLPSLFKLAANFENPTERHTAAVVLAHIDSLHSNKDKMITTTVLSALDQSTDGSLAYGRLIANRNERVQRQVDHARICAGMQIDDTHFKNLMADTQISVNDQGLTKDYTKWNWDAVQELLQGPLLNPKRLDEAIKNTKFLKRLLAFYQPQSLQFSDIQKNKANLKYVKIGCEMLKTLVASPDGVRILCENKLLEQIAESLSLLDPIHHSSVGEHLFSKERMEKTLTGEYFTMLGALSKTIEGVRLMERFKLYTIYYHLTELRSRDDLLKAIIQSIDYSFDGHPRIILSKVMTSAYKHNRIFGIYHLRSLLRSNAADFASWGVPLLVTQLYDTNSEVCERAIAVLEEACNDSQNLETVIRLRPSLDSLGECARNLFLRLLSTKSGFEYLREAGYVDSEMEFWYQEGNELYVIYLELSLQRALDGKVVRSPLPENSRATQPPDLEIEELEGRATVPLHFYGSLAATKEGCELLREKNHFHDFCNFIRRYGLSTILTREHLLTLKAMLWATGKIGSSKTGITLLIEENIIRVILEIAEKSSILSVRGTVFSVLGLMARTLEGVEELENFGWETVIPPTTQVSSRLCVPRDISKYLVIPNWKYISSWPRLLLRVQSVLEEAGKFDAVEEEVLKAIGNMSNHILATNASKTLSKFRNEQPATFTRIELYMQVMRMQSCYHYRLTARKFLQEVFERVTFTTAILEVLDKMAPLSPSLGLISHGMNDPSDLQDGWDTALCLFTTNMSPVNNSGSGADDNADRTGANHGIPPPVQQSAKQVPTPGKEKDGNEMKQNLVPHVVVRGFAIPMS
ncbi:hypothetical protein SeLEV6574_g00869 [Synchytrium endobioticum]|nr:hypothetical protein SeLEV6574_g00869 [Synchytrium endobioticum]